MSSLPPEQRPAAPATDAPINPALKREVDTSHGTRFVGTDPMASVSVKDPDEGRSWPIIWAIVVIACLVLAVWYLV